MTTVTEQSHPQPPPPSSSAMLSRSTTKTTNASHEFLIEVYSLAKGMGIGNHIGSDKFTCGGYQWAIYFYPDDKNKEEKSEFVFVYVTLMSGQGKHKVLSHFVHPLETGPYTLKTKRSMWAEERETHVMQNILSTYEATSGQVISLPKSEVFYSNNVPTPTRHVVTTILGVSAVVGIGKYLGLPSMIDKSKEATFGFIKD